MAIISPIREFYTYIHTKPNGDIFYVGKGCGKRSHNFAQRCQHHKNIVAKYGEKNIGIFVFTCNSEKEAFDNEIHQIAQLRRGGYKLVNLTDGGDGPSGYRHTPEALRKITICNTGRKQSDAQKNKRSAAMKGNQYTKGKFPSEETRKKLSAARLGKPGGMVGRKHKPETIEKMKAIRSNISIETRLRLSDAAKAQWLVPSKRPSRVNTKAGYKVTDETRVKLSEAAKRRWAKVAIKTQSNII